MKKRSSQSFAAMLIAALKYAAIFLTVYFRKGKPDA
jgi:hypothetical protein